MLNQTDMGRHVRTTCKKRCLTVLCDCMCSYTHVCLICHLFLPYQIDTENGEKALLTL